MDRPFQLAEHHRGRQLGGAAGADLYASVVTGANNLIGGSALLGPLGNYGGPTQTMPLLTGSRAIGAGAAVAGITTDQRGLPRPATPDIGAYQTQPVTSFAVSAPSAVTAGTAFSVVLTARTSMATPSPTTPEA